MRLGDARAQVKIEVIPTGGLAIDLALGVGGIPRGRVIEIFGPESSGKTTLMLHVIASAKGRRLARSSTPSTRWTPVTPRSSREPGRPARLAAGFRRGGADHLRNAGAFQRVGCDRD